MTQKSLTLKKETLRYYAADMDLIRKYFPGDNKQPGINEVVRNIVHTWVNKNIRTRLNDEEFAEKKPDVGS